MRTNLRPILLRLLSGAALGLAGSTLIQVLPRINERVVPDLIWFPVPLALASVLWLKFAHRRARQWRHPRSLAAYDWLLVGALAIAIAGAGLLLTGLDAIANGSAVLVGDRFSGSPVFRAACSLLIGIAAGLIEESVIRGHIQLPLEATIGPINAQLIAGAIFVGLHVLTGISIGQLMLLLALSTVAGNITSRYGSPLPAAMTHSLSNAIIASVVLIGRTS